MTSLVFTQRRPVRLLPTPGRVIQLQGVGFKTFTSGGRSTYQTGYSHYLVLRTPVGVTLRSRRQQVIVAAVSTAGGDLARRVCNLKLPDPYKGRGIYFSHRKPTLKQGKRR